jgi:adenylate kinase
MPQCYKSVLLFGGPGTGKGTQGAVLGQIPGFFHFSSGDAFRNLDKASDLGKLFLSYSTKGELVPDDVTIDICFNEINNACSQGRVKREEDVIILDGIPRTVGQAKAMADRIEVLGIIYLAANDMEAMVQRLKNRALSSGRPDDADENVIRNRWEVYENETKPVLEHYPDELIHRVDAMGTIAEVLMRVLGHIVPLQKALVEA